MTVLKRSGSFRVRLAVLLAVGLVGLLALPQAGAGSRRAGLGEFDSVMQGIVRDFDVVGVSVAVARDGKLVLARGYGLADVARQQRVRPDHLFGLASVTKAITAVAVLRLVDEGKLRLDARVVRVLKHLKPLGRISDPRVRAITVRHLLYHAGGFPGIPSARLVRSKGVREPFGPEAQYRVALTQRLKFTPGTRSQYSNFGYVVLRLVIAAASGAPYQRYVRRHVLRPMGITRMRLTDPKRHLPGQVCFYGKRDHFKPIGKGTGYRRGHVGTWLATPTDLVKFLTALDGSRGAPFLSRRMFAAMVAPPSFEKKGEDPLARPHTGLGWHRVFRTAEGWHYSKNGGGAGISAYVERLPKGVNWAVLANSSLPRAGVRRIRKAIERVEVWPETASRGRRGGEFATLRE
jgi:N-acyl-D-amino-acid deacylase